MTSEERVRRDIALELLVADVITAAREVHECHCDPHPDNDDVLAERAGIDRLGLALKALDEHHEKEKA